MDAIKPVGYGKSCLSDGRNKEIILGKINGIKVTLGRFENQINQIILVYIRSFYPSLLVGIKNIPYYFTEKEEKIFKETLLSLTATDPFVGKIEHIKKQTESLSCCFYIKGFAIQHLNDNNLPLFNYGFPKPNSLHSDKNLFKSFLKKNYAGNIHLLRDWSEHYLNLLDSNDENEISIKKGGDNCFSFSGEGAAKTSGDLLCWKYWNEDINYGKVSSLSVSPEGSYFNHGGFACRSNDIIVSLAPKTSSYFRKLQRQSGFFVILCDNGWVYNDSNSEDVKVRKNYECLVLLKMNSAFKDKFLTSHSS